MNTKHTQGPWHIETWPTEPCGQAPHILGQGESAIAKLFVRDNEIDTPVDSPEEEMQANARLIAAAPELLEALQTLAAYANGRLGKNPYCIPEYKQALVAIARALGTSTNGDAWMDANNEAYTRLSKAEGK